MKIFYNYEDDKCGFWGNNFEANIKDFLGLEPEKAPTGKIDLRHKRKCYDVGQGAKVLNYNPKSNKRDLCGTPYVLYAPIVDMSLPIERQEGFLIKRDELLNALDACGLIRSKQASNGTVQKTIQTFWNYSKNAPHGSKYFKLLDELYERCECTLQEWLERERG